MIQQSFIDMENMFELFDENAEIKDLPNAPDFKPKHGKIEFRNVGFHYQAEKSILKDISFTIPAGNTVAMVCIAICEDFWSLTICKIQNSNLRWLKTIPKVL